jgi:hypothetical protein
LTSNALVNFQICLIIFWLHTVALEAHLLCLLTGWVANAAYIFGRWCLNQQQLKDMLVGGSGIITSLFLCLGFSFSFNSLSDVVSPVFNH